MTTRPLRQRTRRSGSPDGQRSAAASGRTRSATASAPPLDHRRGRAGIHVSGLGAGERDGPRGVLVDRADHHLVHRSCRSLDVFIGADHGRTRRRTSSAWLEQGTATTPVGHLCVPSAPARRDRGRVLADDPTRWSWPSSIRIGIAATLGMVNGVAINTAHELGHKKEHLERWFAKIALAPTGYGHFFIEHNRGHHVRVATPERTRPPSRLGGNLLDVPAPHGLRLARQRLEAGALAPASDGQAHILAPQ